MSEGWLLMDCLNTQYFFAGFLFACVIPPLSYYHIWSYREAVRPEDLLAQLVPARPAWPGQNRFFAAAAPGIAPPGLAGEHDRSRMF